MLKGLARVERFEVELLLPLGERIGWPVALATAVVLGLVILGNLAIVLVGWVPAAWALAGLRVGPLIGTALGAIGTFFMVHRWSRILRRRHKLNWREEAKDQALDLPDNLQGLPRFVRYLRNRGLQLPQPRLIPPFVPATLLTASVVVTAGTLGPAPVRVLAVVPPPHHAPAVAAVAATATLAPTPTPTPVPKINCPSGFGPAYAADLPIPTASDPSGNAHPIALPPQTEVGPLVFQGELGLCSGGTAAGVVQFMSTVPFQHGWSTNTFNDASGCPGAPGATFGCVVDGDASVTWEVDQGASGPSNPTVAGWERSNPGPVYWTVAK